MKNNIAKWWLACIDRPKKMIIRGAAAFTFVASSQVSAVAGSVSSSDTYAGDVSVIAVPEGSFLLVDYAGFRHGDGFVDPSGKNINNSNIDIYTNIIRFTYAAQMWSRPMIFEFALPYVNPQNASIGGSPLQSVATFFSPTFIAGYGLINEPKDERYLAFTNFLSLPAGSYDNAKLINPATPGQTGWTTQLSYAEGIGKFVPELRNFWFDGIANMSAHTNGTSPIVGYNSTVQQNSYDIKAYFRYNWDALTFLATGIEKSWGGLQTATGTFPGSAFPNVALCKDNYLKGHLQFAAGLASDLQLAGDITHDFQREGGYKEDFTIEFRLAKFFIPAPAAN
jgi:hypothetical protein